MTRTPPAYSKSDLRKWRTDMTLLQPAPGAKDGLVKGVEIVAFVFGVARNGINIRVQDGSGGPPQMILMNPVVAAALRDAIDIAGQQGGWLDADGQPVSSRLER